MIKDVKVTLANPNKRYKTHNSSPYKVKVSTKKRTEEPVVDSQQQSDLLSALLKTKQELEEIAEGPIDFDYSAFSPRVDSNMEEQVTSVSTPTPNGDKLDEIDLPQIYKNKVLELLDRFISGETISINSVLNDTCEQAQISKSCQSKINRLIGIVNTIRCDEYFIESCVECGDEDLLRSEILNLKTTRSKKEVDKINQKRLELDKEIGLIIQSGKVDESKLLELLEKSQLTDSEIDQISNIFEQNGITNIKFHLELAKRIIKVRQMERRMNISARHLLSKVNNEDENSLNIDPDSVLTLISIAALSEEEEELFYSSWNNRRNKK